MYLVMSISSNCHSNSNGTFIALNLPLTRGATSPKLSTILVYRDRKESNTVVKNQGYFKTKVGKSCYRGRI